MRTITGRLILFVAAMLMLVPVHAGEAKRIVSLSLCTDEILLMLVDRERIAALSYLAADPVYSYMWEAARGIPGHAGRIEEIVPLKPDLIIGSRYEDGNILHMLRALHYQPVTFDSPSSLAEVMALTRAIGATVGETQRAEQIITQMQQDIDHARQQVAGLPRQLAISYGPNGYTAGGQTLKNELLDLVGFDNLAARLGIEHYGNVSLEQLVWARPDVVILDEAIPDQNSLAQSMLRHPVLQRVFGEGLQASLPASYWVCPGPVAARALADMARLRQ